MAKQPAKAAPKPKAKAKTLKELQAERLPVLQERDANRRKANFDVEFDAVCNGKLRELNIAIANFGKDVLE